MRRRLTAQDREDVITYISRLDLPETVGELRHIARCWSAMLMMPLTTEERADNAAILLALTSALTGHLVDDCGVAEERAAADSNLVTLVAARCTRC